MPAVLSQFIEQLFDDGRVGVPAPAPLDAAEIAAAETTLARLEAVYRLDLPGEPPPLLPAAASWAAVSLFHACQFVVFRDAGEEMLAAALGVPPPAGTGRDQDGASVHYSVDLSFRFLPDVLRMARREAQSDPLLEYLQKWAADWPLSSVGVAGVESPSIEAIANHPCLLGVYRDRIIAHRDRTRLGDPRVRAAVQEALGENVSNEWMPKLAESDPNTKISNLKPKT